MASITLSQIITYPIKSTNGLVQQEATVINRGLQYDRHWAICNEQNQVITGREHPALMDFSTQIIGEQLHIENKNGAKTSIPLSVLQRPIVSINLFRNVVPALQGFAVADQWFSSILGFPCRLTFMDASLQRSIPARHGGLPGDEVAFPDQSPILLISEASLVDLNSRLASPIGMGRFRPNLVVKGAAAYAEDHWKNIRIGGCEMEVVKSCQRCVFTTIDPVSKQKHPEKEPLRTLSTYRKVESGGVIFGVYLIPRKTGVLKLGDEVSTLSL